MSSHKNSLVNQEYIREVGSREVYLQDESVLEIGRDRKKQFVRQYGCMTQWSGRREPLILAGERRGAGKLA